MSYYITYKNITSESLGLKIVKRPDIPAPEPVYEPYEIPGRSGILMPKEVTYAPIQIEVEMNFMASSADAWMTKYAEAKQWLSRSGVLKFSDDADHYYNVYQASVEDAERTSWRIGTFTAVFYCDPFHYLSVPVIQITSGSSIVMNPTINVAYPLIEVIPANVQQSGTISVVNKSFTVPEWCQIDVDKRIVKSSLDGDIINSQCEGNIEDLRFSAGVGSTVTVYDGTAVNIWPRWREL